MGLAASPGLHAARHTLPGLGSSSSTGDDEVGPPAKRQRQDGRCTPATPPAADPQADSASPITTSCPGPPALAQTQLPTSDFTGQQIHELEAPRLLRLRPADSRAPRLSNRRRVHPRELIPDEHEIWPGWARPAMTVMDTMWLRNLQAPAVPFLDLVTELSPPSTSPVRYALGHGRAGILLGVRSLRPLVWRMLGDEAGSGQRERWRFLLLLWSVCPGTYVCTPAWPMFASASKHPLSSLRLGRFRLTPSRSWRSPCAFCTGARLGPCRRRQRALPW